MIAAGLVSDSGLNCPVCPALRTAIASSPDSTIGAGPLTETSGWRHGLTSDKNADLT
jgi:hypothetical protein